jgi:hypothetical protein
MSILGGLLGAGASIVGGLLGGSQGGSDKNTGTTSQTSTTTPWSAQQPYLKTGFQSGAGLYGQYLDAPWYQGQLYAGMNPMQQGAATGAGQYAMGQGMGLSQGMINDAQPFLGQAGNFLNGANQLAGFTPQDPTQGNIQNAGLYANNPYINGAIDAASRDVVRNLTEDVLPGINRGAAATGNTNSTRTGVAEGIALRGAQDRVGDIASTIRADAYNSGLGLSEQGRQANMQGMLQGRGYGLDALNTAVGRGMDLRNQGMQGSLNMFDVLGRAGGQYQADQQGYANANFERWKGQYDQPWDLLSRYMGAVGGQNWGSSTQQTTQNSTPGSWGGAIQGALGGATAGLGLYKDFSSIMNTQSAPQPSYYQSSAIY